VTVMSIEVFCHSVEKKAGAGFKTMLPNPKTDQVYCIAVSYRSSSEVIFETMTTVLCG
jgi:hypothetical protein